jgi:hypothetical protein
VVGFFLTKVEYSVIFACGYIVKSKEKLMSENHELDPRVKGLEKGVKYVGAAIVAVGAATIVAVTGGAIIVAGVTVIGAIIMINVLPVVGRRLALWKQSKLTQLAEEFSEETIRDDELREGERLTDAEESFKTTKAELEGAIEELRAQKSGASEDEMPVIDNQIQTLEGVIAEQSEALLQRQADLKELNRVNGLLIAMDRSARAMQKVQGAERDPAAQQRLVTARNAIKTRMRTAIAGQQVDAMRRAVNGKTSPVSVTQLGHTQPVVLPINIQSKEKIDVPPRR